LFDQLPEPAYTYKAVDGPDTVDEDTLDMGLRDMQMEKELHLKVGAQVLLLGR
jgi:hypothetical protein